MNQQQPAAASEIMPYKRAEMLNENTDSWMAVYNGDARNLATDLCKTDFVPDAMRGNPPAVLATTLYGRELRMAPVQSLQAIYSVHGRVGLYAKDMRALVLREGHEYRVKTMDSSKCTLQARRKGESDWTSFTYTMQEARDAGIAGKGAWKTNPTDMLLARCTSRMCRAIFPDVISGLSAEEIIDADGGEPTVTPQAVVVDEEAGSVKRKPRRKKQPEPQPEPVLGGSQNHPEPPHDEPVDAEIIPETGETAATRDQVNAIFAELTRLGVTEPKECLYWVGLAASANHPVTSSKDLTETDAETALTVLKTITDRDALDALTGDLDGPAFPEEAQHSDHA